MARILGWLSRLVAAGAIASALACSSPARFHTESATAHVRLLAGTIGSRPAGTDANRRAREYILDQVRRAGFDARVQEADGVRPLYGASARVRNIIATRPGRRPYAIALVTHYDSVPDGPGAADAALGVAVCLEAGRVLAARAAPNYALALIFTDGEELGMMGASALLKDPVVGWIRAVLNFESIGAAGPALLFQAARGSGTIVQAWTRDAWRPAGSAFMTEIYRHLPADTDLTLLERAGLAGVNFAPAGDSYAYHTPRDSVQRLDPFTLAQMGENAVAIAERLDSVDLSAREDTPSSYFDVARAWAVAHGRRTGTVLFAAALLLGLFGWIQAVAVARDVAGVTRLALTALWTIIGFVSSGAAMLGAAWLLRATRESYHPWYAHPGRFYLFELSAAILGAWVVVRAAGWLPRRFRGSLDPAVAWALILPCWMAVAVVLQFFAPSAAFLAVLPLMAASLAIVSFSLRFAASLVVGVVAVVVAGALWLPDALLLLQFVVALLGRVPVVTPLVVYPALLVACGLFMAPPLIALVANLVAGIAWQRGARVLRLGGVGGLLPVAAVVLAFAWCWFSPAYTDERPLQKTIRYVNDGVLGEAYWEMGGNEPGADMHEQAPVSGSWKAVSSRFRFGTPLDRLRWPFAYRASSSVNQPAPLTISATLECAATACTADIGVVPSVEGLVVVFTLPPGVVPDETSLPGIVEDGAYRAIYAAVPSGGVRWRLRIGRELAAKLGGTRVVAVRSGLPGAEWPTLPAWLPAEHVVWHARSYFSVPIAFNGGAQRSEGGTIN
ncbi:MAG: M28 family peptidase [Bacteroidales bacterium]